MKKVVTDENKQLCWLCEKACGRCSWSRDFTPVPGWKATPHFIQADSTHTYAIHECPEFELAEIIKKNMGRRGFRYDR